MGKTQTQKNQAPAATPAPATAKRVHVRKPLMELLATKLETSLETMAQLRHFGFSCAQTADARFKPVLESLSTDADRVGAAIKTVLVNYTKLVDAKFVPPESVRPVRPTGLAINDKVKIVDEFAARYDAFAPWKGCSKETLTVLHIETTDGRTEYLCARPNGNQVFVRSSKHLSPVA